jgi:hypothetical protein
LLIESPCLDAVKRGKIGVEHDLLAADDEDLPGDARGDDQCLRFVFLRDASVLHAENNGLGASQVDIAILTNTRQSVWKPELTRSLGQSPENLRR